MRAAVLRIFLTRMTQLPESYNLSGSLFFDATHDLTTVFWPNWRTPWLGAFLFCSSAIDGVFGRTSRQKWRAPSALELLLYVLDLFDLYSRDFLRYAQCVSIFVWTTKHLRFQHLHPDSPFFLHVSDPLANSSKRGFVWLHPRISETQWFGIDDFCHHCSHVDCWPHTHSSIFVPQVWVRVGHFCVASCIVAVGMAQALWLTTTIPLPNPHPTLVEGLSNTASPWGCFLWYCLWAQTATQFW